MTIRYQSLHELSMSPLLPLSLSVVLLELLTIGAVDDLVVQNAKTGGY